MNRPTMQVKVDGVLQEREYSYEYHEGMPLSLCPKIPETKEGEKVVFTLSGPEIITLWKEYV